MMTCKITKVIRWTCTNDTGMPFISDAGHLMWRVNICIKEIPSSHRAAYGAFSLMEPSQDWVGRTAWVLNKAELMGDAGTDGMKRHEVMGLIFQDWVIVPSLITNEEDLGILFDAARPGKRLRIR